MSYVRCAVDGEEEIEEKDEKLATGKKIGLGATQSRGVSLHGGILLAWLLPRIVIKPGRKFPAFVAQVQLGMAKLYKIGLRYIII
jgi:hypothetical protein